MKAWPKVALRELVQQIDRGHSVRPDVQYRLLGVRLDGNGPFIRETVLGAKTSANRLNEVRAGDFIYSRLFAWRGAFGIINENMDGCFVSNEFPIFRVHDECLDVRFLASWFRLPSVWKQVEANCTGSTPTTRNRFKEQFFLDLEIPLPPMAEQQAIVARLDALAEKTRQVEVHLEAVERDAERLLALRFRDVIADAPLRPMAEVAPLIRREVSIDPEKSYTELGVRSFYKGTFHRRTVPGSDFSWQDLYQVKAGDLVFSNIMAWEQAIAVAKPEDDGCVGNHRMLTCEVRPDVAVPGFLWFYFTTEEGFAKIYAASPGTAARNRTMTASALMAIEVPVPPLAAQQRFDRLQSDVAALKAKHAIIRQANAALIPATLERIFSSEVTAHA
jgi:type I restriction enzyme S subunit